MSMAFLSFGVAKATIGMRTAKMIRATLFSISSSGFLDAGSGLFSFLIINNSTTRGWDGAVPLIYEKSKGCIESAQTRHARAFPLPPRASDTVLGVCPRFSIRESRGGSFVINAVNGTMDLGWEPLPGSVWHRKVASVGRFRNPFHQERACYP